MAKKTEYLCASGGKCEGKCADEHLHRKRNWIDLCPAAYGNKAGKRRDRADNKH